MAVSRQREYLADASSVELTRNPHGLESALAKLASDNEPLQSANGATQHLYIVNPLKKLGGGSALFSTHPPIVDRINRLRAAHRRSADESGRGAPADGARVGGLGRGPNGCGPVALQRFGPAWYLSPRRRAASPSDRAEIAQLVEHATENRGVASSILALGTTVRLARFSSGSGSVGRASPCQGEGRGFESRLPLHSLHAADPGGRPPTDRASAPSSSGRTADFGSVRRGSNPRGAASLTRSAPVPLPARVRGDVPKWLRGRSAKPLFSGSNPLVASTFTLR